MEKKTYFINSLMETGKVLRDTFCVPASLFVCKYVLLLHALYVSGRLRHGAGGSLQLKNVKRVGCIPFISQNKPMSFILKTTA